MKRSDFGVMALVILVCASAAGTSNQGASSSSGERANLPIVEDAQHLFGKPAELLQRPLGIAPGDTESGLLCKILDRALWGWENSSDFHFPVSMEALANGGHILWNLTELKNLNRPVPAVDVWSDKGRQILQEVDSALTEAGALHYWLSETRDTSGGMGVSGTMRCTHWQGIGDDRKLYVRSRHYRNPGPTGWVGRESNLTPEQWRNAMLLSQFLLGLSYYYRVKGEPARSRADLARVLGPETSAWENKAVVGHLEAYLKHYQVEDRRILPPGSPPRK